MRPIRPIGLMVVLCLSAFAGLFPSPARGREPDVKVAIIVGPVGEALTPIYIGLAEAAASAAESRGARVSRAYSPAATPANVLAAVEDANIVVYLGHGVGTPNPYSSSPDPAATNGWGLQGPNARGTHSDSWADGTLKYYGEAWIAANARPAPGWVMIYSNACYAPGAGEPQLAENVAPETAVERVSTYSRAPLAELGASAYFATDFYEGAAQLISTMLDQPELPYGRVFAADPHFDGAGLATGAHSTITSAEVWLHRSPYFDGKVDYWYAFAGDPDGSFGGSTVPGGGEAVTFGAGSLSGVGPTPLVAIGGVVTGMASYYSENPGYEGLATVALPAEIGGAVPTGEPMTVVVCADRCVELPVVDMCPCHVGTPDQRVANLSAAAWTAVSDEPFSEGLVNVQIDLRLGADPGPALAPVTDLDI